MCALSRRRLDRQLTAQTFCSFLHSHDTQMPNVIFLNGDEIEPLPVIGDDQRHTFSRKREPHFGARCRSVSAHVLQRLLHDAINSDLNVCWQSIGHTIHSYLTRDSGILLETFDVTAQRRR